MRCAVNCGDAPLGKFVRLLAGIVVVSAVVCGCVSRTEWDCRQYALLLTPAPRAIAFESGSVEPLTSVKVVYGEIRQAPSSVRNQAYRLDITQEGVVITASSSTGERYARITLAQLRKLCQGRNLPACSITDYPALRYRGFMNDYGRNYQSLDSIRDTLDLMAAYKFNLFHWHLTDYHGWRLESKKYPQLNRPEAMKRHIGRFYTQKEFIDIVEYAAERGITVIPELDVPGHSEAFRAGMGIKRMDTPGTDRVICELIDELCSLVSAEKMPFVHLGTDEVWYEEEKIPASWYQLWANRVNANGRAVVGWWPGHRLAPKGEAIAMVWGQNGSATNTAHSYFDTTKNYYLNHLEPFEILRGAVYQKPCRWGSDDSRALGALISVWHDDIAPETEDIWNHVAIAPSMVMFGDAFWCGRARQRTDLWPRAPESDDPDVPLLVDLDRRTIAQRDLVLDGFKRPFQYVRQSDMRWRVTDAETGKVLARSLVGAVITPWHGLFSQPGFKHLHDKKVGRVIAETWIHSDRALECGAWIGFTGFSRAGGRKFDMRLPETNEWSRHGASVSINGVCVPPPKWGNPGAKITDYETPFSNEEYYFREPSVIRLEKGWNHVKLTIPKIDAKGRWTATFAPIYGTSAHPREVDNLVYSSIPPQECNVEMSCLDAEKKRNSK